jgi:PHD/YefM family antitoxin component YafN of YafNO toxin-antitoxin module
MTTVNVTNFRKDIFAMLELAVKYSEPINVVTKHGSAIIMSEEDYNGLLATLEIYATPGLKEKIIEGANAPRSELIQAEDFEW